LSSLDERGEGKLPKGRRGGMVQIDDSIPEVEVEIGGCLSLFKQKKEYIASYILHPSSLNLRQEKIYNHRARGNRNHLGIPTEATDPKARRHAEGARGALNLQMGKKKAKDGCQGKKDDWDEVLRGDAGSLW